MLKTLLFIVLLTVISASAFSQRTGVWNIIPYPNTQNFGTGQQVLISAANSTDIATITDATSPTFQHEVRVSHDSGSTWKTLLGEPVGFTRWWAIHHPIPSTYLVTGDSDQYLGKFGDNSAYKYFGLFYFSNDGGLTWKKTILDSNSIVFSGYMHNELEGAVIVGYFGNVYDSAANQLQDSLLVTTDGWKTWTAHGLPEGGKACWELVGLGKGSYLTYSFYPQAFYVTTDDGAHWDVRAAIDNYGINDIEAITSEHLVAVGGRYRSNVIHTLMYESFDQGRTWAVRFDTALGTYNGLLSVSFSEDKLQGVAIGGSTLRTEDGGVTWQFDDQPYELGLYPYPAKGVYCGGKDFALAVMPQNQLLRFDGETTLRAPKLHDHEQGPLPLGPTQIAWTPIQGATRYRLQIASQPPSSSTYDTTVYNAPLLDTLVSDTTLMFDAQVTSLYPYIRVQAMDDKDHSVWSERLGLFTTVSSPGKMLPPKIVSPVKGEHFTGLVTIAWTPVNEATSYEVKLWRSSYKEVLDTVVASTSLTVADFEAPDSYVVTIRSLGEQDSSDWSNWEVYFYIDALGVSQKENIELSVYPNPVQYELHVKYPDLDERTNISIFDYLGNRLTLPYRKEASEMVFDVESVPSGTYLLVMEGDNRIIRHVSVIH